MEQLNINNKDLSKEPVSVNTNSEKESDLKSLLERFLSEESPKEIYEKISFFLMSEILNDRLKKEQNERSSFQLVNEKKNEELAGLIEQTNKNLQAKLNDLAVSQQRSQASMSNFLAATQSSPLATAKNQQVIYNLLNDTVAKQNETIQQLNDIIKKQHESIERFQNDLIYKAKKDLILEIIGISDQISFILQDQEKESDPQRLLEDVKQLAEWVDGTLKNASVRKFVDREGDGKTLDRKRQEITEVVKTDNPNNDGLLVSQLPGYIWNMPYLVVSTDTQLRNLMQDNARARSYEFVIRPEQVQKLRYEGQIPADKSEEETPETKEKKGFLDKLF